MNLLAKKHTKCYYSLSLWVSNIWWEKLRTCSWVMLGQTFWFSHCISTLFIWCCRVCYFAWWTRVLWGHHATLVYIGKMGALRRLCLRAPKSLIWHCMPLLPKRLNVRAQAFLIWVKTLNFCIFGLTICYLLQDQIQQL